MVPRIVFELHLQVTCGTENAEASLINAGPASDAGDSVACSDFGGAGIYDEFEGLLCVLIICFVTTGRSVQAEHGRIVLRPVAERCPPAQFHPFRRLLPRTAW